MKFNRDSQEALSEALAIMLGNYNVSSMAAAFDMYKLMANISQVKDVHKGFRWYLWHRLLKTTRDNICKLSHFEIAGGYYDVDDSHIQTLLNKVIVV